MIVPASFIQPSEQKFKEYCLYNNIDVNKITIAPLNPGINDSRPPFVYSYTIAEMLANQYIKIEHLIAHPQFSLNVVNQVTTHRQTMLINVLLMHCGVTFKELWPICKHSAINIGDYDDFIEYYKEFSKSPFVITNFKDKVNDILALPPATRAALLCIYCSYYSDFDENTIQRFFTNPSVCDLLDKQHYWMFKEQNFYSNVLIPKKNVSMKIMRSIPLVGYEIHVEYLTFAELDQILDKCRNISVYIRGTPEQCIYIHQKYNKVVDCNLLLLKTAAQVDALLANGFVFNISNETMWWRLPKEVLKKVSADRRYIEMRNHSYLCIFDDINGFNSIYWMYGALNNHQFCDIKIDF